MNYGKLAYQQLGDMDARLLHLERRGSGEYRSAGFTAGLNVTITSAYPLPELVLALPRPTPLYVELTLSGNSAEPVALTVELLLDGSPVDAADSAFSAGGFSTERRYNLAELAAGTHVLAARVAPGGGTVTLTGMTITAFGTDIAESGDACAMAADGAGNAVCVAVSERGDKVTLTSGEARRTYCGAKAFDVCYLSPQTLLLAAVGTRGELRLMALAADTLTETDEAVIDTGVSCVSLAASGGAFPILAAYVKKGGVYLAGAACQGGKLSVSAGEKQDYQLPTVAGVAAVKSHPASPAIFAATGGGVCYAFLYPEAARASGGETLACKLRARGEANDAVS